MIPGAETAIIKIFESSGKDLLKNIAAGSKKAWSAFSEKKRLCKAAEDYSEKMRELYGKMKIFGMPSPVELKDIFTSVNILNKPSIFCQPEKDCLKEIYLGNAAYGESIEKGLDGMKVIRDKNNASLFILGKPGAGKTTFLKHVTLESLNGSMDCIPIFIELKKFSDTGASLMDYLVDQFDICDFPDATPFIEKILKEGKAIVLFDGLDEVNKEKGLRSRIIREIIDFTNKHTKSQHVITCRTAATDYSFERFTYVEMADFSEAQIKTFSENWFEKKEKSQKFFDELKTKDRLFNLAQSPLLLTLLCISYQETLTFPDRRTEIYEEALDALLKKWDTSREIKRDDIYKNLSLGRKRHLFSRIAAETFEKKEYLLDQKTLENKIVGYLKRLPEKETGESIDGEAVLKAIEEQHGILVERAKRVYSFSHLTFQEYYTARYIAENAHSGVVKGLVQNHLFDDDWREVFLLTAEMLNDADAFFDMFHGALIDLISENRKIGSLMARIDREADDIVTKDDSKKKPQVSAELFMIILYISEKFVRARDLTLNLNLACTLALDLNLDLTPALNLDLALALDIDPSYAYAYARGQAYANAYAQTKEQAHAHACAQAHARAHALARALDFCHSRDLDLGRDLALDFALDLHTTKNISNAIDKALSSSKKMKLKKLHAGLSELVIPYKNSKPEQWENFFDALWKTIKTHLPIKDYTLSQEDVDCLNQYLKASKLLIECLEVAYVSDREAIKAKLFQPPPV